MSIKENDMCKKAKNAFKNVFNLLDNAFNSLVNFLDGCEVVTEVKLVLINFKNTYQFV
jgi:hypothetical protein